MLVENQLHKKSIGGQLRSARLEAGLSLKQVASKTKIRAEYLQSLEDNDFDGFDSSVYARGILKNYAYFLELDADQLVALYKRDHQHAGISINPDDNSRLASGFSWNISRSKSTYVAVAVVILIVIYLGIQLSIFMAPPTLRLSQPISANAAENSEYDYATTADRIIISGTTDTQTLVTVNGVPVSTDATNGFTTKEIPLPEKNNQISILSTNQFGRVAEIVVRVERLVDTRELTSMNSQIVFHSPVNASISIDGRTVFDREGDRGEHIDVTAGSVLIVDVVDSKAIGLSINGLTQVINSGRNTWELESGAVVYSHN